MNSQVLTNRDEVKAYNLLSKSCLRDDFLEAIGDSILKRSLNLCKSNLKAMVMFKRKFEIEALFNSGH